MKLGVSRNFVLVLIVARNFGISPTPVLSYMSLSFSCAIEQTSHFFLLTPRLRVSYLCPVTKVNIQFQIFSFSR